MPPTAVPAPPTTHASTYVPATTAGHAARPSVTAARPTTAAAATLGPSPNTHVQPPAQPHQSTPTSTTNPRGSGPPNAQNPPSTSTVPTTPASAGHGVTTAQSQPQGTFFSRFRRFYGSKEPIEWVSVWLRPHSLSFFLVITLGLIGGVATVQVVSKSRNGLANVSGHSPTFLTIEIGQSLWWTFFPVLIFQTYTLWFVAIVSALGDRQPFVELRGARGAPAPSKTSILLDYRNELGISKPFVALGNLHYTLSLSFFSSILMSVFLTSLASHLFSVSSVLLNSSTQTRLSSTLQPGAFTGTSDLTPVLDIVSSTRVYGGTVPGWANDRYSFQSFDRPKINSKADTTWDYLANTSAYSSELQCRVLEKDQYILEIQPEAYQWIFLATDDGCETPPMVPIQANSGFTYYVQTVSNTSCSPNAGFSRIFVLSAATRDPTSIKPSNVTVLACRTSYIQTQGRLNVTYSPRSQDFTLNNFQTQSSILLTDPTPLYSDSFESQLQQPSIYDNTATISATDFGRIILAYARKIAPDSYLEAEVIKMSTATIYTAAFAIMASTFLWESSMGPQIHGTAVVPTERLIVTDAIAYILLGCLSFLALITMWIAVYVIRNESSLYEEPQGLLGFAIVLFESDVNNLAGRLRKRTVPKLDGRFLEDAKERKRLWGFLWKREEFKQNFRNRRWKVKNWDAPETSTISEFP
jgi:Protein of unknown function (DUF3433)